MKNTNEIKLKINDRTSITLYKNEENKDVAKITIQEKEVCNLYCETILRMADILRGKKEAIEILFGVGEEK